MPEARKSKKRQPPAATTVESRYRGSRRRWGGTLQNRLERRIAFSKKGSLTPRFIFIKKYFSSAIFAKCTHFPFLAQVTLRGALVSGDKPHESRKLQGLIQGGLSLNGESCYAWRSFCSATPH